MADQPSSQQTTPLKRKASTEFPPNYTRVLDTEDPSHPHAVQMASVYEQVYIETTAEVKKLLQKYSLAASSTADDDKGDKTDICGKDELQAILNDLAGRPEFAQMDEVKSVLNDCGIQLEVRQDGDGKKVVNVQLQN